ncbi:sensor domain-containing diguanylate cyclase [Patulibacter sp. SYSU D01012]|uniref:sensor domain-containing diguanylate cyclase n=1 Tax=Patulibacter sp. SYSU D01012 TaxID=2817381 RepID=UPI001B30D359
MPASAPRDEAADEVEALYEDAPCAHLVTLPDGLIVRVNRTFERWTGHDRADLVGRRRFQDLVTTGGRIYHETHLAPMLHLQGAVREIALDVRRADGTTVPVLLNAVLVRDGDGGPLRVRTSLVDCTERRQYETELRAARDREGVLRRHAERLQRLTGELARSHTMTSLRAAIVAQVADALDCDEAALALHDLDAPLPAPGAGDGDAVRVALVTDGHEIGAMEARLREGAFSDAERELVHAFAGPCAQALHRVRVLEELDARSRQLERLARTDVLTGLANRRALEEEVAALLRTPARGGTRPGVALVDLDRFKAVNDTHGHHAGDAVLSAVAAALRGCVDTTGAVGRWGGEEFLVAVPATTPEALAALAQRLRTAVSGARAIVDGAALAVTASVGAAVHDGGTLQDLLRRADAALYRAKDAGRDRATLAG